jgi:chemotaxis family two-component system response regulator Rcp1
MVDAIVDATNERFILVIDENPEHIEIIQTTLQESEGNYRLMAIANASDALDFLHHREPYETASRPDLMLLDLNLSGVDGFDLLADIKAHPQLHRIPIIVFTSSEQPAQIFRTYALRGNCYVIKAEELHHLAGVVKRIEEFWLGIVTLPVE